MTTIGQPERATQNRVLALFQDERGYKPAQIKKALHDLSAGVAFPFHRHTGREYQS